MVNLTPTALAALADGGAAGVLATAGGALRVALFNDGAEVTGNGYSRKTTTTVASAVNVGGFTLVSFGAVTFAAIGGDIEYDSIRIYSRSGAVLFGTSGPAGVRTIEPGLPHSVTPKIRFPASPQVDAYFWDFTTQGQLSRITGRRPTYGLEIPGAIPWLLPDGSVYARDSVFVYASEFQGVSFWDHEPEVQPTYSTGTIGIVNGVVTGSGTNFPTYGTNALYFRQLHVNGVIYDVSNAGTTATSMVLVNTSVNVAPGTAFKYASWDFREVDPKYATNDGEWQQAQDEMAFAMADVETEFDASGARPGIYEYGIPSIYRRTNDIIDDADAGLYEEWLANLDEASNYVTASGFKLVDWIRDRGGYFVWTSYVPHAYIGAQINWTRYRLRNERIHNALLERNIPNIMLLLRTTADTGYGQFLANNASPEEVPRALQTLLIQDSHARCPGSWGFWGPTNSANVPLYRLSTNDTYISYIQDTVADLTF